MSKRKCRKCESIIPNREIIEGKVRNLCNRKYCLSCSPYGCHNTKKDIDIPSKKSGSYKNWSEEAKLSHKSSTYQRGLERKRKLVEMAGGCCQICKYDKCLRSLSFHHRVRNEKRFGLTMNELWARNWEEVLIEYNKCDLLCLNCHAEIEHEISLLNRTKYRDILTKRIEMS
jgi:hypothetical protein